MSGNESTETMKQSGVHSVDPSTDDRVRHLIQCIYLKNGRGKSHQIQNHHSLVGDLGFDSLEVLELITEIEKEFSIVIPDEELRVELFNSVASLIGWVHDVLKKRAKSKKRSFEHDRAE